MKKSFTLTLSLLSALLSFLIYSNTVWAGQYHPALCHSLKPEQANDIVYVNGTGLKNRASTNRLIVCPFDVTNPGSTGSTTASVYVNNGFIPVTSPQMTCTLNGYYYPGFILQSVTRSSDPLFTRITLSLPIFNPFINYALICNLPPNTFISVLEPYV